MVRLRPVGAGQRAGRAQERTVTRQPPAGEVPISVAGSYFGGPHSGITIFGFVDGHVQPLSNATAIEVLTALATRNGGESVDASGP